MERRSTNRYRLHCPILVKWDDTLSGIKQDGGFTRDLGTNGLCAIIRTCPPVEAEITVEVLLSCQPATRFPAVILTGSMRVVWMEERRGYTMFAAAGQLTEYAAGENVDSNAGALHPVRDV